MALSGLDIYKLLPKTNCRECGFVTCLAFAMQIAKKAVSIDKCPYLSSEAKKMLEASSLPPIRLVSIGTGESKLEIGNETVLFRHEEKFHHPCGVGIILDDNLSEADLISRITKINKLSFERVGQKLDINLIAVRQTQGKDNFVKAIQAVLNSSSLGLILMALNTDSLKAGLQLSKDKRPLIYQADAKNINEISGLAKEFNSPLTVYAQDLGGLSELTKQLNSQGLNDLILNTGEKPISDKLWDLTQIRRQALKKSNRSLGYPVLAVVAAKDPFDQVIEASSYIAKYAGIVLIEGDEPWQALSLLTLRQNIYTDPQKPLQIEPQLYPIGAVSEQSPVLVTTNFSLSYFTVLGEVESSKIPSYILSVDTEGMSVLTAWAAEKFTPEKIADSLDKSGVKDLINHKKIVIPGYVAMMSGELEDKTSWQIVVGPKEAAGLPSFLKNL